jgi:hypothetical protein
MEFKMKIQLGRQKTRIVKNILNQMSDKDLEYMIEAIEYKGIDGCWPFPSLGSRMLDELTPPQGLWRARPLNKKEEVARLAEREYYTRLNTGKTISESTIKDFRYIWG